VKYKTLFLPFYQDKVYKALGITLILGKENSISSITKEPEDSCEMNQKFLKKIIKKENQMNKFMEMFYNKTLYHNHANSHLVCKIRELDVEENEEEIEAIYKEEEKDSKRLRFQKEGGKS